MSDGKKDLILKTLLVIGLILFFMCIFGPFLLFLVFDEEIALFIHSIISWLMIGVGFLFMILCPIFGGLKPKTVKADKSDLGFNTYDDLLKYLKIILVDKGYIKQKQEKILDSGEISLFLKKSSKHRLSCFTVIKVFELSEEIIDKANDTITKILMEYYGNKTIRDSVDMISVFCVDRITPSFQKLVNSNMQQGFKNGRLVVGVSFGGKNMYIAKQTEDFAIAKYKRLRKEFIDIIDLKNKL